MKTSPRLTFNIKETAEILVPDKMGRVSYIVALTITAVMFAGITVLLTKLPPIVPLWFTLPWGEARLAMRVMLYILPTLSFSIAVLNLSFGRVAGKLSPLLPRVLSVSAVVVTIMSLLALVGIVQSVIL